MRAITVKSILFSLLGVVFVSGLAGFHDNTMWGSTMLVGSHLPPGAYFFIVFMTLVWNAVFSRTVPRLVLNSRELVVVMIVTLVACFPPTSGLMRYFQRQLVLPWYYLNTGGKTDWETLGVMDYLPLKLFPQPAPVVKDGILQLDQTVYRGFFTGLAQTDSAISISEVPFGAWLRPLAYWGPLVILMSVCVLSLSLLVHQQWAHHEQLSYPLAQVALSFVKRETGKGVPDLFRNRLFWWGFTPIFMIYLLQCLHLWFPEYVPGMNDVFPNLKSWYVNIYGKIPLLKKVPYTGLNAQVMYFSVIGLAFFVSSEIGLTMGLSSVMLAVVGLWFFGVTGTPLATKNLEFSRAGAYIGYALILLYTGRSYYGAVLKKAFFVGRPLDHERGSVMAARLVILSFIGFVGVLVVMGLDWFVAFLFSLLLMLMFLVFTRVICETGIPLMQPYWMPGSVLVSLFGASCVGPGPLVFVYYLGTILCQDPRECLMPYAANGIKMADDAGIRTRKIFVVLGIAVVVALTVAFVSTTWTYYNIGALSVDPWAYRNVPTICFDDAVRRISEMGETGVLEQSAQLEGISKLILFSPDSSTWGYILVGAVAVIVFSVMRFRIGKFPIHPVLFLIWGTYPARKCWASFLVGWGIKCLVVKFGGGKVFQKLKPLFIGVIAGELIAVGAWIFFEIVYYWITGETTNIKFNVLLG